MNCQEELSFLKEIIQILTDPNTPLAAKLDTSLHLILETIQAQQGSIMLLVNPAGTRAKVMASTNKKIVGLEVDIKPETISGHVFTTGEPIYFKDINKSQKFKDVARKKSYQTNSLICVPLKRNKEVIGVINVSDPYDLHSFTEKEFRLLLNYAGLLSPLVENSYLVEQLTQRKQRLERLFKELRVKQKELLLAFTERNELVQMVVHDFKSPLSAVISNLDLLNYLGGLSEEQQQIVKTALNGAQKLLEMINEFLQIARIDDWKNHKLNLGPVDLQKVIEQVVEDVSPLLEEKNLKLEIKKEDIEPVYADENLLYHLIQNLLSNAIKYSYKDGKIKIGWEKREAKRTLDQFDHFLVCWVEDTGPGVPDNLKKAIFERFNRLKRDVRIEGTGIGLFICKQIVKLWDGEIWVEDVQPHGSRFCFTCYVTGEKDAK
ncbi:MAG: GAF domain-containing sensor histidine kinase [Desulfonauticus sp.]|nr:GAF domain-containing sensor histidine kinase [Desulfonauticus sp.]